MTVREMRKQSRCRLREVLQSHRLLPVIRRTYHHPGVPTRLTDEAVPSLTGGSPSCQPLVLHKHETRVLCSRD